MNQVGLLDSLYRLERVLQEVNSLSFVINPGPGTTFSFNVSTTNPPKAIQQTVTPNADPEQSLLSGQVLGAWKARETIAITEVLKKLVALQLLFPFTSFVYSRTVV